MGKITLEKIKIASLKKDIAQIKKDYKKSLDRFNGLMEQSCRSPKDFPDGFIDVFAGTVVLEYSSYKKHE